MCTVSLLLSVTLAFAAPLCGDEYAALQQPIEDLALQIRDSNVDTIAVVDFTDLKGNVLELGRSLAEEMTVLFVIHGKPLRIVDRTSLHAILAEHKLTQTGLVNPENAKRLGQISEVDALVTGTITPLEDSVRITLKVIETESASLIGAATASLQRTRGIDRLLQREVPAGVSAGSDQATETGQYEGVGISQRIHYLEVTLRGFEILEGGTVRATLAFKNLSPDNFGLAVALKAEHSDGLADFWKFFPTSAAEVTDDMGNTYRFGDAKGLGFARDKNDWSIINAGEERLVTMSFRKATDRAVGDAFSLSSEIRLVWRTARSRENQNGSFNIFLTGIRPKGL